MSQRVLLVLPVLLTALGCASVKIPIARYNVVKPQAGEPYMAGAAKVDITPPPGYPMGGHSIGGRISRGYWTRLYARAFYFQDTRGNRLILVSCDLFAIPAGLQRAVAHDLKLPPEALILSATHTHHGPAGYMSSSVFNFGGPLPGFDPELFRRLRGRIVAAIDEARANAQQPGQITVVMRSGFALDLQRNRAIDAFFKNDGRLTDPLLRMSRAAGQSCPDNDAGNQCPRYQAVDPALQVLEMLRGGQRIGLLVFFAIHATAMSHDSTLNQSDLAGYAMTQLEMAQIGNPPVVAGFFNGAEGDVSPRWVAQNRDDVITIGRALAGAVTAVLRTPGDPQPNPEISIAGRDFPAIPPAGLTQGLTLPGSGVGELGGAEDGRTMLYAYGWHGGVTAKGSDPKRPALDLYNISLLKILQKIIGAPGNYPQSIPVSVAGIGNVSLAAIPTEMTTLQGVQLRQDLLNSTQRRFVLIGLANEYIGYTTTEAEYAAQDYEGASTMYGKRQGEVIVKLIEEVARKPEPSRDSIAPVSYNAGAKTPFHFGPEFFGERYNLPYEDLEPLMPDPQHRPDDSAPRFEWNESPDADWKTYLRSVKILRLDAGRWTKVDDDGGTNVLTVLVEGRPDRLWTAIWTPPKPHDRAAQYVFWVKPPWKAAVCSETFRLDAPVTKVPMPPAQPADCPRWSER